ncbi:MAG: amino acid ABC transporter permease [Streptococcaceae bacterium]|jgi:polar amino acid transport system permease protein|nr:amino acid ABC transporter permease [Streptococcaceae bacterium]MCH4176697.1 amino acid ABC transporter permease [Streptococcaceae bacterium]
MSATFSDYFNFELVFERIPKLLKYLPITLELSIVSMIISLILGFVIAVIRVKRIRILYQIAYAYLSVIRGTPMIIQLYIAYYGIPAMLRLINPQANLTTVPGLVYAFIALGIYESAFTSETIRAAIQAVDKDEIEAATALGMNYGQILRRVIIPSALEIAIPGLINSFIGLVKGTSLASACGVIEITYQNAILSGRDYRYLEGYLALAIIYWVITFILERIQKVVEEKIKIPEKAPALVK